MSQKVGKQPSGARVTMVALGVFVAAAATYFGVITGLVADLAGAYAVIGVIGLIAVLGFSVGVALVVCASGRRRDLMRRGGALLAVLGVAVVAVRLVDGLPPARPELVSWSSGSSNARPILSLPRPNDFEDGDIMIATLHGRGTQPVTADPGWTEIPGAEDSAAGDTMQSFWRLATGDEPSTFEFDTHHPHGKGGGITVWRGVDRESPIADSSTGSVLEKRDLVVRGVTTPRAGTPVILNAGAVGDPEITMPSDMRTLWSEISPPGEYVSSTSCAIGYVETASGSGDKITSAGGDGYGGSLAELIALRPAT